MQSMHTMHTSRTTVVLYSTVGVDWIHDWFTTWDSKIMSLKFEMSSHVPRAARVFIFTRVRENKSWRQSTWRKMKFLLVDWLHQLVCDRFDFSLFPRRKISWQWEEHSELRTSFLCCHLSQLCEHSSVGLSPLMACLPVPICPGLRRIYSPTATECLYSSFTLKLG